MTDTSIIYHDAFIFLFIFIVVWILYVFDYEVLDKVSDQSIRKYLNKLPLFRQNHSERLSASNLGSSHYTTNNEFDHHLTDSQTSYGALIMLMRRLGFALLLMFCLPVETVHMFKSNAQYYWSILAFSLAIYQCIKLLVIEQLEQFDDNRFIAKFIHSNKNEECFEKELITLAICCSLFFIVLLYVW